MDDLWENFWSDEGSDDCIKTIDINFDLLDTKNELKEKKQYKHKKNWIPTCRQDLFNFFYISPVVINSLIMYLTFIGGK